MSYGRLWLNSDIFHVSYSENNASFDSKLHNKITQLPAKISHSGGKSNGGDIIARYFSLSKVSVLIP